MILFKQSENQTCFRCKASQTCLLPTIKTMHVNDRPRERLLNSGVESLSDAELLSIVLRSGGEGDSVLLLASRLLAEHEGLKNFFQTDLSQLMRTKNIGFAKASCVKAVYELALRLNKNTDESLPAIRKPEDIYQAVKKEMFGKKKEHLYLISLDSRNKMISKDLISIGTIDETMVNPREVYRQALIKNASSIAVAHNHPSGNPSPSSEDLIVTEKLIIAGISLGLPLVDHLIVCDTQFVSLKALNVFDNIKFKKERG